MPEGSQVILAVSPFILVELFEPMPGQELVDRYKARLSMRAVGTI
jgi:hypothetical protein